MTKPISPLRQTAAEGIDKSQLTLPEPRRIRNKEHVRFVAQQACLVCGRRPSDPHHLRHVQLGAIGRKSSDEFTVPLCRIHHRALHRSGDEQAWWKEIGIDPRKVARALWKTSRLGNRSLRSEPGTAPIGLPRKTQLRKQLREATLAHYTSTTPASHFRLAQLLSVVWQNEPNEPRIPPQYIFIWFVSRNFRGRARGQIDHVLSPLLSHWFRSQGRVWVAWSFCVAGRNKPGQAPRLAALTREPFSRLGPRPD